jgi:hypothetical protein
MMPGEYYVVAQLPGTVSPLEDILGQRLLGLLQQQLHFLRADLQTVDNSAIHKRIHV